MKKYIIFFVIPLFILILTPHNVVYALDDVEQLHTTIDEQIDSIKFDNMDEILNQLENQYSSIGEGSFKDKVKSILNGTYYDDYGSLFSSIISLGLSELKSFIPTILIVLCIAILSGIIGSFKSSKSDGIGSISHFACYGLIIMLIAVTMRKVCAITSDALSSMQTQMNILFPILLTLMTAVGGVASVGIYTPVVSVLTNIVSLLFGKIMYPIFIISFIFVVLGHLTDTVKLKKFTGFLSSAFKWMVGIIFTLFSGLLTIQGISAGKADGVRIKLTKFTIKSYIPIIGSYISEGMDMIVLSSMLIKNAVGLVGLIMLLFSIISPIITIVVFKLCLKLCAGLVEPLGNSKISSFLDDCSNVLIYPIVILIAIAFMYMITISLIISTANVL